MLHVSLMYKSSKHITLKLDEDIIHLLPDKTEKLAITLQGLFKVLLKTSTVDYLM